MVHAVPALLLASIAFGSPQAKQFVGTYELISMDHGKPVDNKLIPVGRVRYLELHAEGHWVMRDMQTGFDGTWQLTRGKIVMTAVNGPAGKLNPKQTWILAPKPDRRRLIPVLPQMIVGQVEFHFAPHLKETLARRTKAQKK